ncbi:MAG TPA: hypothetical protein VL360_00560 [Gammaproteobacteria bacterium]|jgi:hypothetical protein|nr:hypothetical protein [Gammaproteobacteria bacterium]
MALSRFQIAFRNYMRNHFKESFFSCNEESIECLLSDEDLLLYLNNNKEQMLAYKRKQGESSAATVEKLCDEFEDRCIYGSKTFIHAFLTTLIDKYFRPYLTDIYHCPHTVGWIIEILKSIVTFSLVASVLGLSLDVMIRNALKAIVQHHGHYGDHVDNVINRICSVIDFTQNPLSVIDINVNDTAADIGQKAAFAIIHSLPKLRIEPEAMVENPEEHAQDVIHRIEHEHPGIRHRHTAHN